MVSRIRPHLFEEKRIHSPYAPVFRIVVAEVRGSLVEHLPNPIEAMGKGLSDEVALTRLYGEAVERVSISARGANGLWRAYDPLTDETREIVPDTFFTPPWYLRSHGCACHNLRETAVLGALAELWERRAVQDWWEGGRRLLRLTPSAPLYGPLMAQVSKLRLGASFARSTQFCLIEGPYPFNVAVAISSDLDETRFAIAFEAGSGPLAPLFLRAFEELLSVEFSVAKLAGAPDDARPFEVGSDLDRIERMQAVLGDRLQRDLDAAGILTRERLTGRREDVSLGHKLTQSRDIRSTVLLIDLTHQAIGIPTIRAIFEDANENPFINTNDHAVLPL